MTLLEQIKIAKQEVVRRQNNYPKFIEAGRLTQLEANYQIDAMRQIVCTLTAVHNFLVNSTTIDKKDLK